MRGEYKGEVRSKASSYSTSWLIHVVELKGRVDNAEANKRAILDKDYDTSKVDI